MNKYTNILTYKSVENNDDGLYLECNLKNPPNYSSLKNSADHRLNDNFNSDVTMVSQTISNNTPAREKKSGDCFEPKTVSNVEPDVSNIVSLTKVSPIEPCSKSEFQTSTPSKSSMFARDIRNENKSRLIMNDSGIRSSGSSPVNSSSSTPRGIFEPIARTRHSWSTNTDIPQTCADRMKTKTSLMDFKRLLLEHGKSTNSSLKKSAVEQLTLSKATSSPTNSNSPNRLQSTLNILNLSASPKTFATRRMIRQGNYGSSPVRCVPLPPPPPHISPRTGWRYNNVRSNVISSAIPEASNEEDGYHGVPEKTSDDTTVLIDKIDISKNIFLKSEENNFMKHEVQKTNLSSAATRTQLHFKRTQFLQENSVPNTNKNLAAAQNFAKMEAPTSETGAKKNSGTSSLETAF